MGQHEWTAAVAADGKQSSTRPESSTALWSLVSIVGPLLAAIVALGQSWNRWLEPIIDLGRDLYIPGELLHGSQLYSDILYYYPPTAPYLLAAIGGLFGRSLTVYTVIGIVTAIVCGSCLYLVARAAAGVLAAGTVLLLFASLNVAAGTTWGANFIYPYAHAATFGMTFLLLSFSFLYRHLFLTRVASHAWIATLFAFLAAITKIEWTVGAALLLAVGFIVYRFHLRYLAAFVAALLGTGFLFNIYFTDRRPGHGWLFDNVLASSLLQGDSARHFYGQVSGLGSLRESLILSLSGFGQILLMVVLLAVIDRLRAQGKNILAVVAALSLLVLFALASADLFFMGWAPAMALLVPVALLEWRRSPLLLILFFALLAAARIILFLGPWWYGFVLTLPLYLLIGYVLFRLLPERRIYTAKTAKLWLLFFLVIAVRGLIDAGERYAIRSYRVETRMGVFYEEAHRGAALSGLLRWLETQPPEKTLVMMPEGLAVNYFGQRRNPLSFHTFTPVEIADPIIEARVLAELTEQRPDFIALVPRDVTEFGYRGLGIDYGQSLRAFIEREYTPAGRAGDAHFHVTVFRSRNETTTVPDSNHPSGPPDRE